MSPNPRQLFFVLQFVCSLCLFGSVSAALISYEGFNYSPGSFATGANLGSDWNGTWTVSGGPVIASGSLYAPVNAPLTSGNRLEISTNGTAAGLNSSIAYGSGFQYNMSQEGTVRYASMLVNKSNIAASGDEYIQLSLGSDSGTTTWLFGMSSSESFFLRSRDNGVEKTTFAPGTPVSANTTYLLISKLVTSATGTDSIYLSWYAEGSTVPLDEPVNWMFKLDVNNDGVLNQTTMQLQTGRAASTTFRMDEIRLGTTWASVVPEPSKGVLSLFGACILLMTRGRRSSQN